MRLISFYVSGFLVFSGDLERDTAQKPKFSIKDLFSKCNQIRSFLRIWPHLLKKSLMENFIFCAVRSVTRNGLLVKKEISNLRRFIFVGKLMTRVGESFKLFVCATLRKLLNTKRRCKSK